MLQPTKFNDIINIYTKTLNTDDSGSSYQALELKQQCHADVRDFKIQDYVKSNLEIGQYIITIAIRYQVECDLTKHVIEFANAFYDITNITKNKLNGYKILTCQLSKDSYYTDI